MFQKSSMGEMFYMANNEGSIQCIVYENDRKKATDKKEVIQDNSTQEYIPPKTGEEHELFILSFLLGISVVSIGVCGYTLGKNRKGADRI